MMKLLNWSAKRSGGRITVIGKDRDGNERKVPNVDNIIVEQGAIFATDKDGDRYQLLVAAQ